MRPYLAFDLDAKKKTTQVARAWGRSPGDVAWGLLEAWERVWLIKNDVLTALELAGAFGPNPPIELLVTYGFLEVITEMGLQGEAPAGWRVKGAEKYLKIHKAQSLAGKANAGNLRKGVIAGEPGGAGELSQPAPAKPEVEPEDSSGSGPAFSPNTQHPTSLEAGIAAPAAPPAKKAKKAKEDRPPDPRHAPLVAELCSAYEAHHRTAYGFGGRDAKAVSELLSLASEPNEAVARWEIALAHKGFPLIATISDLVTHWNRFPTRKVVPRKPCDFCGGGFDVGMAGDQHGHPICYACWGRFMEVAPRFDDPEAKAWWDTKAREAHAEVAA